MTTPFYIIPQKLIMAVLSTLLILRLIELGGASMEISLLTVVIIVSGLLSSSFLPQFISKTMNTNLLIVISYLGLAIASYMVSVDSISLIYISAMMANVSAQTVYYVIYLDIHNSMDSERSVGLSRLETIGGATWVFGLIFATYLSLLYPLYKIGPYTASIAIIALMVLLINNPKRINGKVSRLSGKAMIIPHIHKSALAPLNWSHKMVHIKKGLLSKKTRYLFVSLLGIQFALSFALTHFIPYLKALGYDDSHIFLLTVISSIASASTYSRAGKKFDGQNSLFTSLILRIVVYYLILMGIAFMGTSLIQNYVFLLILFLLIGISWAYIYIDLSSIIIGLSPLGISYSSFISGIGSVLGAVASGLIYGYLGYSLQPALSIIILLGISYLLMTRRIIVPTDVPTRRFIVIYQQRHVHIHNR